MATKHGNRVYIQVLLEPNRGLLFLDDCEAAEIKPSAKIKEMVYDYLASELQGDEYWDAAVLDRLKWREAVESRLAGRAKARRKNAGIQETQCDSQLDGAEDPDESSAA